MRHPIAAALAVAATLAACTTGPEVKEAPRLGLVKCQHPYSAEPVLCGSLDVPENWLRPLGRSISLNVVVVPATGTKTLPPLYNLEGGPGLPASGSVGFWADAGAIHRRHRDIVLIDQRGTGGSNPLPCTLNFASPFEPLLDIDATRICRYQLLKKGDLSQYTTAATVADIDAVREALGHEQIDLIGMSYGTRVAQQYLNAHPKRVRAMALIGTLSPQEKQPRSFSLNAQAVLTRLAEQCQADKDCRRAVPDMTRDIKTVQAKFKAGPVRTRLADGKEVALEAGPFWEGVRALMVTTTSQRALPWLIHEAAQGRFAPILAVMPAGPDSDANGLLLSVSCQEDTLNITEEELAPLAATVFGDYRARRQMAACSVWPGSPLWRAGFVTSDVPVLLMAGEMDHATPAQWAQDVASGLLNARVVTIPYLGHLPEGLTNMDCYDWVINSFFEDGNAASVDASCIGAMKPPPFQVLAKP